MADENKVELEITAETSKAEKSLADFEKGAGKSISNITTSFKALGAVAAAALAFVAGKEVISFFSESAAAAAANEAEIAKLEASLKSVGDFTPQIVEDFKEFADQLETTSKFSDDAAIAQLAFAKQLGLTNKDAKKLVQTAADLASVTGDTLEGAVGELGRTLTGTAGALSRTIPEVKAFSEAQLKSGAAIDLVSDRLQGAAKNAINTYQGALIQLDNAQDDFRKSVGSMITQNPILIEAIKASREGFGKLQALIEENREAISGYLTMVLKLAVNAIPIMIESFGLMLSVFKAVASGMAALTAVTADTISGFLQFETVQTIISGALKGIQFFIGSFISNLSELLDGFAKLPGASAAFEALGFSIEDAQKGLRETADSFLELSREPIDFSDTIDGLNKVRDDAVAFGNTSDDVFSGAQVSIKAIAKVARETAAEISKADGQVAKSAKEAGIAQTVAGQASVKASVDASKAKAAALEAEKENSKTREKLASDAEGFINRVFAKEAATIQKVDAERKRDLEQLEAYQAAGVIGLEKAEALRANIILDSEQKILDIRRKKLEEFKKEISEVAANPIKVFVSEIDVDTDALKDIGKSIAAGIGGIGAILKGKQGATDLVAGLGGAFADAFLPGIGGAVSQILTVFAQGPDAVKAMVKDFVAALPEVITAIAESAPAFVEALVETLVNKGGAVRIALAITKASFGLAYMEKVGRQIFGGFSADVPKFTQNLTNAVTSAFTNIGPSLSATFTGTFREIGAVFSGNISAAFGNFISTLGTAFTNIGSALFQGLRDAFQAIGTTLSTVFQNLFNGIGSALSQGLTAVFQTIGTTLSTVFQNLFGTIGATLSQSLSAAFQAIGTTLSTVFQNLFNGIGVKLSGAVSAAFVEPIKGIAKSISDSFATALSWVSGVFQKAFDLLAAPIEAMRKVFTGNFADKIVILKDVLLKPINALIDFLGKFKFPEIKIPGINLGGGGGGGGGVVENVLGRLPKFAAGGIVPDGFPNDSFQARLTSKEMILPPDIASGLTDLVKSGGGGGDDEATLAILSMLGKIAALLAQPTQVTTTAEIDGRALAQIILNLNRQNARLSA